MAGKYHGLGEDERQRMCSLLLEDISISEGQTATQRADVKAWRELMMEDLDETPMFPGASTIRSMYVKQSIMALVAQVFPQLCGVVPMIHVEGYGQYKEMADEWETFYQELFTRETEGKAIFLRLFFAGLRDSSSALMTTWLTRSERRWGWREEPYQIVDEETGGLLMEGMSQQRARVEVVSYDWPQFTLLDCLNYGALPAHVADTQKSSGLYIRHTVNGQRLVEGAASGMFDPEVVENLLKGTSDTSKQATPADERHSVTPAQISTADSHDAQRKPVTIVEAYYRYQPKAAYDAPAEDWLFTINEETSAVLREIASPFNARPVALFRPYGYTDGLFGESVASTGAGAIQDGKTSVLRLCINAMIRGIDPRIIVPATLFQEMNKALGKEGFKKSGALIPFPDAYFRNASAMQPLINGYNPATAQWLLQYLDIEGDKGTAGSDTASKGVPYSTQITATQAQQIGEAQRKLLGMVTEAAAETMAEVARQTHELIVQNQDRDSVQELWQRVAGSSGIPLEVASRGRYTFSANGLTESTNTSVRAQRAIERFTILSKEPRVMTDPKRRWNLMFSVLRDTGTPNPQDFLGQAEEWATEDAAEKQTMAQMAAMAGGGPGQAGPGAAGGSFPNIGGGMNAGG